MPNEIEDYALIGNCETAALVARDGSIDWLCVPRFDSGACFASLLGTPENGRWQLKTRLRARVERHYRPHTMILETVFRTAEGQVTLIDFMPVRERDPRIVRIVRGDRGTVRMQMDLAIRFDYGLTIPWVTEQKDGSLLAIAGPNRLILHSSVKMKGEGFRTISEFTVKRGQTVHFELQHLGSVGTPRSRLNVNDALRNTEKLWNKWARRCTYKGPWADTVERSLLTLKALTYHPTGGIVAAPTTSLPEKPGGDWNWDYRFCWVRDATFTLLAFLHAGFHKEARRWKDWLVRSAAGVAGQMQIMYGVGGERLLQEWEVPWLAGYQKSLPVRIGNLASEQVQLDVYGELIDTLHQEREHAGNARILNEADYGLQFELLEHLCEIWREPDHGIWEIRGARHHYTHSKVMAWVALDRTLRVIEKRKVQAPIEKWRRAREEIHKQVCRRGFDSRIGSFVQSYGSKDVDASLLLLPLVGFLPPSDPRITGTIRRIEQKLLRDGFVMRYTKSGDHQQLNQKEGAFLPCSFWLVDYYALAGRRKEAEVLLKRLLKLPNDLGLLSEEYHTGSKKLIGNFPQALSHVALVNTIINLHSERGPARQRANSERLNGRRA
jgi:GH15 family glucan-1,4-alpha-glucosidase